MQQITHLGISAALVGTVEELSAGRSRVSLTASAEMAADGRGLVHGGFTFGLADYAAMLAVNDPNVVLGSAEARFLAPVRVGEVMTAVAEVGAVKGRKHVVKVRVEVSGRPVLEGEFTTFVLDLHVLDG